MGQGEERPLPKLLKLKPPKETDDPKLKKRSKNKNNINKEITNYRRIDEMFKVKSNENNQEMAELTTSKDGKMKVELKGSSSKNDFQAKPAPQQVDQGRTFLKFQLYDGGLPLKPNLDPNDEKSIFPANNLGESSRQISENFKPKTKPHL